MRIELDSEKTAKTKQLIFSKVNIVSSNLVVNIYSNEVKNRYVQFSNLTSWERVVKQMYFMVPYNKHNHYGETF